MKERERRGERKRLKSLKWGALIIGPGRCLSRQPFPSTLLEMSTAGNWIRLAVRVEPRLTDAQTGETRKWQMFLLLLKPECKAVTSRYRPSDGGFEGSGNQVGLLKSMSREGGWSMGGVDWRLEKSFSSGVCGCLVKVARDLLFLLIKRRPHCVVKWGNVSHN